MCNVQEQILASGAEKNYIRHRIILYDYMSNVHILVLVLVLVQRNSKHQYITIDIQNNISNDVKQWDFFQK